MSCEHSGDLDLFTAHRPWAVIIAVIVAGATLSALSACAQMRSPVVSSSPTCFPGAFECPIDVAFAADRSVVKGNLSPEHSSASYAFFVKAPARLQWSVYGPAVRTVLAHPDGNSDGPGLPSVVPLATAGRYVFSLASNTMAEGIYGPFRLEMRLLPSD
jgi:hypothetical protein